MSKNYRVWKWNVLANIRPIFFFLVQLYLCAGWYQVRYFTKSDFDRKGFISFDSNPLSNLAFILCIVHAVIAFVVFIPHGVLSLVAHFDSPSSKRLCEWSAVSSTFLTLVILVAEKEGIRRNFADSALLFFSSILVNVSAFNHIGIPDLFLFISEFLMVPLWIVFLAWVTDEQTSGAAALSSTFVLGMIAVCAWMQQREYRLAFAGQNSLYKVNQDFLRTINYALKYGDEKLKATADSTGMITSSRDHRPIVGSITSIRYWYLAISAALLHQDGPDDKYVVHSFVQLCRDIFLEYERAVGKSVPIFFDSTSINLKITARANLLETLIFGLLEYNSYKDLRISRICRLSCVDDDDMKNWKFVFEIICNRSDAEQLKTHNAFRRNRLAGQSVNNKNKGQMHGTQHQQQQNQHWQINNTQKNELSLKYLMSLEKEPVAKSEFESSISGSILTVMAEKFWKRKFEHSTDEMEEFFIEKIEISLPSDICTVQSDLNASVATTSAAGGASNTAYSGNTGAANSVGNSNNAGTINSTNMSQLHSQLNALNIAFPLSKYQPWIVVTPRIHEPLSRVEIRTKLNKLLVPTQLVQLENLRTSHRFGILLISEQLLSKLTQSAQLSSQQSSALILSPTASQSASTTTSNIHSSILSNSASNNGSVLHPPTTVASNVAATAVTEYPDLLSLRAMTRYLIVVTDNDVDRSDLTAQYHIDVDRAIFSKTSLVDLFETVMSVYHDLRHDFDMSNAPSNTLNASPHSNNVNNPNNNANSNNSNTVNMDLEKMEDNVVTSGELLVECVSKIRRLLRKSGRIQEHDADDGILHDCLHNLRSPKTWENSSNIKTANTNPNANVGGDSSGRSAVLQYIEDPRRRRQAELTLEFVPRLFAVQEVLNASSSSRRIDWQDVRSKLHDLQALASNKGLWKLEIWLRTLKEVVSILINKWPQDSSTTSSPVKKASSSSNSSSSSGSIASQKRSMEDVVEDFEESDVEEKQATSKRKNSSSGTHKKSKSSSSTSKNHRSSASATGNTTTATAESSIEEEVLQHVRQLLAAAQLIVLHHPIF